VKRLILLPLLFLYACGDTIVNIPNAPTPIEDKPIIPASTLIEFRVTGNADEVLIRYSNPLDGLTQTTSGLPFFASFSTARTSMFLSIAIQPNLFPITVNHPFISAQILVDGILFREASSVSMFSPINISGNWRK